MKVRPIGMTGPSVERREEIERAIAVVSRACKQGRRLRAVSARGREDDVPNLLRDSFDSLGGAFLLFGRYLAARRDLLPAAVSVALETLSDSTEPLDVHTVRRVITDSLGGAAASFASFDDVPFESNLAWQAHRARIQDGRPVVVRVVHSALAADVEHLDLLDAFGVAICPAKCPPEAFRAAVEDFQEEFRAALDLRRAQEALGQLAEDTATCEWLAAPDVHRRLSSASVLTCEPVNGSTLADHLRSTDAPAMRDELARLLTVAWLQQATFGRVFPTVVTPSVVELSDRHRIAFSAGPFHSIPLKYQAPLRDYLLYTISDPDRACSGFLRQMRMQLDRDDEAGLRRQFRQTVPFRDSEWCRAGDDEGFEHHLWVHWRSATEAGFVPLPHMAAFYRGLTGVARLARALSPHGEILRHGLDDLQKAATLREVLTSVDPNEVCRVAGEYLQLALAFPERIDELLRQASDGRTRVRLGVPSDTSDDHQTPVLLFAIVLLCSATVLFGQGGTGLTIAIVLKALLLAGLTTAVAMMLEAWK